jgi:hypothetical protein
MLLHVRVVQNFLALQGDIAPLGLTCKEEVSEAADKCAEDEAEIRERPPRFHLALVMLEASPNSNQYMSKRRANAHSSSCSCSWLFPQAKAM